MKMICLIVTFLAGLSIVFFAFSIYFNGENIEKYNSELPKTQEMSDQIKSELQTLTDQLSQKQQERDVLAQTKEKKEKVARYKTQPTAFLTFDDGPSAYTLKILDILKEYDIKATFFIVGTQVNNSAAREALQRIVNEGHTLAIHAYNHVYNKIYASADAYFEDLDKIAKLLEDETGYKPDLVRLPGGTASAQGFCKKYGGSAEIFDQIMDGLSERGYMVTDWNVDTEDWNVKTTPAMAVANAVKESQTKLSAASKYKTSLVLMHDKKTTIESLPDIIKSLKDMGFSFEPMANGGYSYRQR